MTAHSDDQPAHVLQTGVLRWEDPPSKRVQRGRATISWSAIANDLRANPDKWGVVYEDTKDPSISYRIKNGRSPWFQPAGSFDAEYHRDGSVFIVYAKYLGEPS